MFGVCAVVTAIGRRQPRGGRDRRAGGHGLRAPLRDPPGDDGDDGRAGRDRRQLLPIGIFGSITNGVVESNDLPGNQLFLFLSAFLASTLIAVITYVAFGGRALIARGKESSTVARMGADAEQVARRATHGGSAGTPYSATEARRTAGAGDARARRRRDAPRRPADRHPRRLVVLMVGALGFDLDVGFTALTIAVALTLVFPQSAKGAVEKISWGTVLLIGGIVTYVTLLESQGVVDALGDGVAGIGAPLVAALLICFIGSVVSAFASTTGIIGALIPLAVPFLLTDEVSAIGLIAALAISSSVVDCSPFSTNGAPWSPTRTPPSGTWSSSASCSGACRSS